MHIFQVTSQNFMPEYMKHLFIMTLLLLPLTDKVRGQAFPGKTWVGNHLEYLKVRDSTADVDVSVWVSKNEYKCRYINTATEHSLSFGTLAGTTIPTDTGRAWIDFYIWKTIKILALTDDTLIIGPTYIEHSILDSIYRRGYSAGKPTSLMYGNDKPIIFIDSSKVSGSINKFQLLQFYSPGESINIDSAGNFKATGYILDSSEKLKNYSFQTKLKKEDLEDLIKTLRETGIQNIPSYEYEPSTPSHGGPKSSIYIKADNQTYQFYSSHRQLYWLRSKLIFYLIRLNKKLNKERTNSPYADRYDKKN